MSGGASNQSLGITEVRPKVEFGMARDGAIAHRVKEANARLDASKTKICYGALWHCNNLANDAILLPGSLGLDECRTCKYAQQPAVYHYYDIGQQLIYIGSTDNYVAREMGHQCSSPWWPDVASVKLTRFPTITHARVAERRAILAEDPVHNVAPRRNGVTAA